ncbi:hypothetical protein ABI59_22870 [Acidobacteria bacterium Mor1]|nr:hypothetical protein ABI59_22870 [Acidobacteria bacterium Mor1]
MKKYGILILILALACFAGCGGKSDSGDAAHQDDHSHGEGADHGHGEGHGDSMASAEMAAKSGSSLSGKATFVPEGDQVTFTLFVEGVEPGTHAVHIHETGDCSADDGTSAGGHWNPTGSDHGEWGGEAHHLGDLGNMEVGENGQGTLSLTTDAWSIGSGADNDIVGKSVIVHAVADDFTTQPTGAAGGRIGCGVIQKEM